MSTPDFVKPTALKRDLGRYAKNLSQSGRPVDIGLKPGRPRYRLMRSTDVAEDVLRSAVRVGIDEARKNFFSIRCSLELEPGIAFAIVANDQVLAVLTRHPDAKDARAVDYVTEWRTKRSLENKKPRHRRKLLERLAALIDEVDVEDGSIRNRKKRQRHAD